MQRFRVSPYDVRNSEFDLEYATVWEVEQAVEVFKKEFMKYQEGNTPEVTLACALARVWCVGKRYEREKHSTV
jgi:hypothetical protein